MDIKLEVPLLYHISIVIKLLNNLTDKNRISSTHVLHRLDYLYERLSDFLGRELDNGWWSQEPGTRKGGVVTGRPILNISESSKAEHDNIQSRQYDGITTSDSENLSSSGSIFTQLGPNFDVQSNGMGINSLTARSSSIECGHWSQQSATITEIEVYRPMRETATLKPSELDFKLSQNFSISETASSSNKPIQNSDVENDVAKTSSVKSNKHRSAILEHPEFFQVDENVPKDIKQEALTSLVDIGLKAKGHVIEQARTDLGEHVIEKVTTSYFCQVCYVNVPNTVGDHVSKFSHQENMKKEMGMEVAGIENTASICERIVLSYYCQLCSIKTTDANCMWQHLLGKSHVKMMQQLTAPNMRINTQLHATVCDDVAIITPPEFEKMQSVDNNKLEASNSKSSESVQFSENITSLFPKDVKQETSKTLVDMKAKGHVIEKARVDLGEHVIEKITTSYFCQVCDVDIPNTVCSHVSALSHQENMRNGIEAVGTQKSTESICEKSTSIYSCQLCSVNTTSIRTMEQHLSGKAHTGIMQDISDQNIICTKKGRWICKSCNACLSYNPVNKSIRQHLQGMKHQKRLEELNDKLSV